VILREPATELDPRVRMLWLVENLLVTGLAALLMAGGTVAAAMLGATTAAWLLGGLGGAGLLALGALAAIRSRKFAHS